MRNRRSLLGIGGDKPKVKEKEGCEKATGRDGHRSGHVENVPEEKGGPSSKDGIR